MSGGRIRAEHLQCAWCDDKGKGSAQFETGQWFDGAGMNPKVRVYAAWSLLILCCIAYPITALTVAREEPPIILMLSWGAIIITCLDIVSTQDVRKEQEDEKGEEQK